VACCVLAGVAAIVHGYHIGEYHLTAQSEFMWFWAGMLLLTLPLIGIIARAGTPNTLRTALLTLYAILTYAPKLLRNPSSPLYHDEFAHWRGTYEILHTGKLFSPNPIIPITARYPGLHAATAALVNATGLNIWQAAIILLVLCHLLLVLGIASLGEGLGMTNRIAALAAIIYSFNSSFLYFDTQFAYESMAVTLVVWTLVAYIQAIRARSMRERAASCFLTVLLSAGTIVTHHLSTFSLLLIMAVIALALSMPWLARTGGWARTASTAWGLTLAATVMAGFWFVVVAPSTLSYLSPYLAQGLSQLMEDARGTGAARQLFGASLSPWWEQRSAYLVVLFALGLAVGGLLLIRARIRDGSLHRGPLRALLISFILLGVVYFPSVPFILSPAGAEGARRSWAFTWIGLAVLAAAPMGWLLDAARRRTSRWSRVSLRTGLTAAISIAMIGGTAAGQNAAYRFPGPFLYGSDARAATPELLAASAWFSAHFGTRHNLVADRTSGLIFGSYGLQNLAATSTGFPTYKLYLAKSGSLIPPYLLAELKAGNFNYMIVDRRMAYDIPTNGVYFSAGEPSYLVPATGKSVFYGRLDKFNSLPWMIKVFQSDNYSIYRLNLPVGKTGYSVRPPPVKGRLVVTP
jgi:hypothetical protein